MKGVNIIDKREFEIDNLGNVKPVAWKGHIEPVKVIEINELESTFLSHKFDKNTIKLMFFAQFDIDYCGG